MRRALRSAVLARDGGVCALCHLDTKEIGFILVALRTAFEDADLDSEEWVEAGDGLRTLLQILEVAGFKVRSSWRGLRHGHLWEADHRVPLAEGGADTLENCRTLCCGCHRRVTKGFMAKHRARVAALSGKTGRTLLETLKGEAA